MKNVHHYILQVIASIFLIFLAVVVAGQLDLYDRFEYVDKVSHFFGGVIVAWFFSIYLGHIIIQFPLFKRLVVLIACVSLIGVLWEFAEYLSEIYSPDYLPLIYDYFRISSLTNTLADLGMDLVGGLVFGILFSARRKQSD